MQKFFPQFFSIFKKLYLLNICLLKYFCSLSKIFFSLKKTLKTFFTGAFSVFWMKKNS